MKKLYLRVGLLSAILVSTAAFSQQKVTDAQIQPVLQKLRTIAEQNPLGPAYPVSKLNKEEIALYQTYKLQQADAKKYPYGITSADLKVKISKSAIQPLLDKVSNLAPSQEAFPEKLFTQDELKRLHIYELQNQPTVKPSKVGSKAYAKNARAAAGPFGTLTVNSTPTFTHIADIATFIYADDIAGDGKLYGLDNTTKDLLIINEDGTTTTVGHFADTTDTTVGLSWNPATSTMYAIAGTSLYTVDLATGAGTYVAPISGGSTVPIWLEIDNSGNAFIADIVTDMLYSLNLTTGAATEVGSLGININFAQEADFNTDTNVLHAATYTGSGVGGIYTINTTTGAATLVGSTTTLNAEYTVFSIADTITPPVETYDKAYVLSVYDPSSDEAYGTIPLEPPYTLTPIALSGAAVFADDQAADDNIYGLNADTKSLVKVYSDGSFSTVGPLGIAASASVTGLSYNWVDGKLYAIVLGTSPQLYTVNPETGVGTLVATITGGGTLPIWLEIDNSGVAYSADISSDSLYKIDLTTGVATLVGPLGINLNYAQDADFNRETGELFMAGFLVDSTSGIYKVDLTTGAASYVGDTEGKEIGMFTITNTILDPPPVEPTSCGDTFTDTGGEFGNYDNSEDIVTVIEPETPGDVVKVTFTAVDIESTTGTGTIAGCWDYLSVYNGPTVDSPVLAAVKCGQPNRAPSVASSLLAVGDSFQSTDPSGALTFRFRSDSSVPRAGWVATVSCVTAAVDDVKTSNFMYYPNPTTGILNIKASGKIELVEVYNVVGQKVMTFTPNAERSELNFSSLKAGVYLVKSTVNGTVNTTKVIKK